MTNIIDDIYNTLFDDGEPCDLGWFDPLDDFLKHPSISLSKKPYCAVKNWVIWDLEATNEQLKEIERSGNKPILFHSRYVIDDQLGRFRHGEQVRSSWLKQFHPPAFFETSNTVYVLVGRGTRKSVAPKMLNQVFFGD